MMPYAKNDQDNCEIVEDLPEQFDLSRYRRVRNNDYAPSSTSDRKNTSPPSAAIQQPYYSYEQPPHPPPPPPPQPATTAQSHYHTGYTYDPNYAMAKLQTSTQQTLPQYHHTHYQHPQMPQQQSTINSQQYTAYPNNPYGTLQPQQPAYYQHQHQHQQIQQDPYRRESSYRTATDANQAAQYPIDQIDPKYSKPPSEQRRERSRGGDSYRASEERPAKPEPVEYTMLSKLSLNPSKDTSSHSEDDSRYSRQSSVDKRDRSVGAVDTTPKSTSSSKVSSSSSSSSGKKRGVQFDEKLCEVYEVENPHYGQQVKSEKRAIKNKKKTRQKEEDLVQQTKIEMKTKIQTQSTQNLYQVIFY